MRIGQGYDVHKLVEGRKLILGGVTVPYEKGLLGHSDADVLVHAVMDALLGAAALGDIGQHFPDTDPKYKGISSIALLKEVGALLEAEGYVIENIDATIIAQRPKLAAYRPQMAENIADALHRRRQAQSMSAWLSSMLMRACTFPMVLIFLTNALLCVGHLKKQSERFAYQRVSQQAEFVNRQYQRCKDFLWNFSMDYLIQEYMREGVYDKIVTFFQEYSATLWNKCSERDLLSSISIYDAEWNNIYETGSIAIPLTNEAQRHFRQNFNSIYTVRGDNHVFCYFAIRNTHETSESSHLLQKLGYVAIAVADPVDTLSHSLPDARFLEEGASFPTAHGVVFPIDFPSLDLRLTVYIPTQSDLMDNISPIWLSSSFWLCSVCNCLSSTPELNAFSIR